MKIVLVNSGDDRQALIWDISPMPRPVEDPILAYQAEGEVILLVYLVDELLSSTVFCTCFWLSFKK